MRQSSPWLAVTLIAGAHAYAFLFAWGYVGAHMMSFVGRSTSSFTASSLAASFVTAIVVTAPLALLAGALGGKQRALPALVLFPFGWLGMVLYSGVTSFSPLVFELSAIALVSSLFYALGNRTLSSRAAA